MKKWLVAVAILLSPAAVQSQSFTAHETGDPFSSEQKGAGYLAVDWRFGHGGDALPVEQWPAKTLEQSAFGFLYQGPAAYLDRIEFRALAFEGNHIGVHLLQGPTRAAAQLLTSWTLYQLTLSPVHDGVGTLSSTSLIPLSTGHVYWLSFFAADVERPDGFGKGVFWAYGGEGESEYVARSFDDGQTWQQAAGRPLRYRVTAVAVSESPRGFPLVLVALIGVWLVLRRSREAVVA